MIEIKYIMFTIYVILFLLVFGIAIYNILFALYSSKAKNELVISLPSFFNKLISVNIFIAFLALLFIFYNILKNAY